MNFVKLEKLENKTSLFTAFVANGYFGKFSVTFLLLQD